MENETAQVRILASFFSSSSSCLCENVTKGLFIFCIESLRVLLFFQSKWTNVRRCEQKILNKYNTFG